MMSRIILIGCGKSKASEPRRASELYTGSLFRSRVQYAKGSGDPFFILSAKYGLVGQMTVINPYDQKLSDLCPLDRIAWAVGVVTQLCDVVGNDSSSFAELRKVHLEIHAGADYADRLGDVLLAAGFNVSRPMAGLSQGQQMKWYADRKVVRRWTGPVSLS